MYALTQDRYTFNSRERFSKSAKEGDGAEVKVKWTVNTNEWRMSSVISPATTVFRLGMRDLTEEKIVFTLPKWRRQRRKEEEGPLHQNRTFPPLSKAAATSTTKGRRAVASQASLPSRYDCQVLCHPAFVYLYCSVAVRVTGLCKVQFGEFYYTYYWQNGNTSQSLGVYHRGAQPECLKVLNTVYIFYWMQIRKGLHALMPSPLPWPIQIQFKAAL